MITSTTCLISFSDEIVFQFEWINGLIWQQRDREKDKMKELSRRREKETDRQRRRRQRDRETVRQRDRQAARDLAKKVLLYKFIKFS